MTNRPIDDPPTDEPPTDEPPIDEPPTDDPPIDEPPIDEPPTDEPPIDDPPIDEPPIDEPPIDEPPIDEPPIDEPTSSTDPRFDWTAFEFTENTAFTDVTLPLESSLSDLFLVEPDGTDSFSNVTTTTDGPVETATDSELGEGTNTSDSTSTVTLSQDYISPDEWRVTQSVTNTFESDEDSTDADRSQQRLRTQR